MWRRSDLGPLAALLATLGVYLAVLLPRLLWWDPEGNLWVGHEHLWSDWPLHIAMLRRFADLPPPLWLADHPMIAGEPLRYPFAAALVSGLALRAGMGIRSAVLVPTGLYFAALLPGLYVFWRLVLGGRWRSVVAVVLFFLTAGPGALDWIPEVRSRGWAAVWDPPREYGRVDEYGWYAGNFLTGMLLPQRAFLPGMALGIWSLVAFLTGCREPDLHRRRQRFLVAGVGIGILPVVHLHTLVAVSVVTAALGVSWAGADRSRWRSLTAVAVPALTIAGCLALVFLRPSRPFPGFVSWHPGFVVDTMPQWLGMWWRIWGISVPTAIVAHFLTRTSRERAVGIGSGILFALGNLIRFQPIPWDNSKIFLWAYVMGAGSVAAMLALLWRARAWRFLARLTAVALTLGLTLTGMVELIALQRTDRHRAMILAHEDIALGEAIRQRTDPTAVFLTAPDIGNAPMTWGARPIFLGFTGWMANFGFAHEARERDLRRMLEGQPGAEDLLREHRIRYVLMGPSERQGWRGNQAWYEQRFGVFYRRGDRTVFDLWTARIPPAPPSLVPF